MTALRDADFALLLRRRHRSNVAAAGLGLRLCESQALSVFTCYFLVLVPLAALALAAYRIADWIPLVALWWAKPWLDRTLLFALSRAAFGQATRPGDLWRERRQVWCSQLLLTFTERRLSPWRSFTQPVYQLEGLEGTPLQRRVREIRTEGALTAAALTSLFACAETLVLMAVVTVAIWLAPRGYQATVVDMADGVIPGWLGFVSSGAYVVAIALVEPFFVAAGFAMYLNRRATLEAWGRATIA